MTWNNVIIALRNLRKHKVFALMNIIGLAIGLVVFVFGNLLVNYEANHDANFANANRIYSVGSIAAPELDVGVDRINSTFMAVGPVLGTTLSDIEHVSRSMAEEYLITRNGDGFYQQIRFVDAAFFEMFDFEFLAGDPKAMDSPSAVLMTESSAIRYFGRANVLGETVTLDNEFDYSVAAIVRDLPRDTHFNSSVFLAADFEVVMSIKALGRMRDYDLAGDWNNLALNNMLYVQLPASLDQAWLQSQLDAVYERIVPVDQREVTAGFYVTPLKETNLAIWDTLGLPVIEVVRLLSLLVLVVACVNYTNLATAQSLGRSREVGMRKTMGAGRGQLLTQFLTESVVIATLSMLVAIAALELIIPLFNAATDKMLVLDYLGTLPWLALAVLIVGVGAGIYPTLLITKATPIEALRDTARKGRKGSRTRSLMIGGQFAISAFMLAIVAIVFTQNERVKETSFEFPRSEVYVLNRLNVDDIRERLDVLENELEALPRVDSVTFSSQVPFEQNNSTHDVARLPGDEAGKFAIQVMRMRPDFLETYDIPVLAGRSLDRNNASDERTVGQETLNVIVNELAIQTLGFASPQDAIGERFFDLEVPDTVAREYVIVGVVPTQNITGLFNSLKPWVYWYQENIVRVGSVRITAGNMSDAIDDIERAWKRVIPDYPIQGRFLDDVFDDVYNILKLMNSTLAGFAFIAMALALFGLFGLAAFMATQRTKEIGVRKVLGANNMQIARLLVWQFSRPVLWALAIALPLAWFAASLYLNFFSDRIPTSIPILAVAGLIAVLLAWLTVAGHAVRIARANPVRALRYE
ncbi:MAG: FtsX-like permease family protein [Pseudomonadota bacterium]